MRNPLSKKIVQIQPSGIRKFFDIVSEMPDAISLGVGEPDFDTPWRIREEGIYTLEKGKTFYTYNMAEINGYKTYGTDIKDTASLGLVIDSAVIALESELEKL